MKKSTITIAGLDLPLVTTNTVIIGAGAAGMNCALQLANAWRQNSLRDVRKRLLVLTGGVGLGASRMSGSDKQTYYKMGTSPRTPDTAVDFARTLTAFGCCHGDTALIEGICSLRGFYNLVESGVPFPHDPLGAFIGYKTDHDPHERATSAGPKTSRFMSECLQARVLELGVPMIDRQLVVNFVATGQGDARRIRAVVCQDMDHLEDGVLGLRVYAAENFVLAGGGPGEIYAATVYPRGQYGIHGPALLAGLEACNLTESQFGLASTKFRWNVSGTYMQVVPRIFSTDADGNDPRDFLTDYFDDMPAMATNTFLKGYQWPFDAQRIAGGKSSLIDMAVHMETSVRGRRVWMDFLQNPVGKSGWKPFAIADLAPEAREYLEKTGALQARPIDRLAHMNTPAIDIYTENGIDLWGEPLEIAVCAQHNNGGFSVNAWWESSIRQTFVIGEMAGTHGVKRPGGSALNAGQVGALRAAEYIANACPAALPRTGGLAKTAELGAIIENIQSLAAKGSSATVAPDQAMTQVGRRMTNFGAHLRWRSGARDAAVAAAKQYRELIEQGLRLASVADLPAAILAQQQCLTHLAMLVAVREMLDRQAGSRGSHCVLDDAGEPIHPRLADPETGRPWRVKPENLALREHILCLSYAPDAPELFKAHNSAPRPLPDRDVAFETAWRQYREGTVYGERQGNQ